MYLSHLRTHNLIAQTVPHLIWKFYREQHGVKECMHQN